MANTNLTADIILKEAFRKLRNNTFVINKLRPQYDSSYAAHGSKEGEAVRIKQPMEYTVRSGKNIDVQDQVEKSVTLSRSVMTGIDMKFSSAELTQDISDLSRTHIEPAVCALAADLEYKVLTTMYQSTYNAVALPVTSLDRADILGAGVILDQFATPRDGMRCVALNPQGQADVVTDLAGLFQSSTKIAKQYEDGEMGTGLGFTFGMTQGINSHTTGGYDANYVTNGAGVDGASTLDIDTGTGTITKGDTFTVADCYSVNPLTKVSTGKLQRFVATAASAGGTVTLPISPTIIASGPYQNVSNVPGNGKAVTFLGTASTAYPQNMAFHPYAFAFATVDLELPKADFVSRKTEDGISMRLVGQYDVKTDETYWRLDLLHGIVAVEPRKACRIYGL